MSFEDNENLYVLKEEEKEKDDSPMNYASYVYEDEEGVGEDSSNDDNEETEGDEVKKTFVFGNMFRILFNPVEGWKTLRRRNISVEMLQSDCFYPLLAVLAVSNFAEFFYSVNVSLITVVTQAVVDFVAFFFGYFCIPVVITWFLTKGNAEKFNETFGKKYILISLSTLVLFSILTKLLPMLWPILIFLPIWTLYIMFKGVRFFRFAQKDEVRFYILAVLGVIGLPVLIDWVLNTIMPY